MDKAVRSNGLFPIFYFLFFQFVPIWTWLRVPLRRVIPTLTSMVVQSSAAGVLALLSEPDPVFKQHALTALIPLVPQFWAEISEQVAEMFVRQFTYIFAYLNV